MYFRIEGSDVQSGRAVCRVTEAMDESAAQQWAVDVAQIRVARIVSVGRPVWMRGVEEASPPSPAPAAVVDGSDEDSVRAVDESDGSSLSEIELGEPELMAPQKRVWSAKLNERWEGQTVAANTSPGPFLPLPEIRPARGRLPEPITGGLLASMMQTFTAPREPLTPIQLVMLGLITLDVCAVVGLMLRGSLGAEPVGGVFQLYVFATLVNLPALAALLIGWGYAKRTGDRSPARQTGIAFFMLLAGVFVVTVAMSTGQLTTREAIEQQARVRNSHRPSITREREQLAVQGR